MKVSDKPKVTIGVCARNSQDIIGHAIESVILQDYPHELMEIIFVDDDSNDATLDVIRSYASKIDITTRIFSGGRRGLGRARNTVLEHAIGDFIVWVDSDEILEKNYVRRQICVIKRDPKVGIVTGILGILPGENLVLALDLVPSIVEYSYQNWSHPAKLPGTGGSVYRVVAAKEVGGFRENIESVGEDIEIARRIRDRGWLIRRGGAVFYERHSGMSSWLTLWRRNVRIGNKSRFLHRSIQQFHSIFRMNPISSLLAGVKYTVLGYKLTKNRNVVLLPFHYAFKMTAWFYGFSRNN